MVKQTNIVLKNKQLVLAMKNKFFNFYSTISIVVIFFMLSTQSEAQEKKRATFWHFGNQVALDFTCQPVSFSGSQMNAFEGSATISDTNGVLQFYTQGTTVWDRNNNVMPNGTGLLGNPSSVQAAVIVPHPGNNDRYFIFTTDAIFENNGINGLQWHEVDMTLNAGNGDVITKNNMLTDKTQERLVAVRNATSTGYWIVVLKIHPTSTSSSNQGYNEFHAYEVTAAGVNPVPVISTTGPMINWNSYGMYMSPQGNALVTAHPDFNVYDFNNSTGALVHKWQAVVSPFMGSFEFSPDGNILYGTRQGSAIYQFDLNAANLTAFENSMTQVSPAGSSYKALQLGPDCRLYAMPASGNYLSAFNNPNVFGAGSGFVQNAVTINSGTFNHCLTNFCASFFENPCLTRLDFSLSAIDASCVNDGSASVINLQGQPQFNFLWSTGATTQTINNLSGGMYTVTVSDASGCNITDSIFVNQPQTVAIDSATITNASTCGATDGAIDIHTSVVGFDTLTTLLAEGFETDGHGVRYTANPYPGTPSTFYFFTRGDDNTINFTTNPTNEEGSFYFGARRTGFSSLPVTCDVTTNPTNIAGYSNIEVCVLLALGRNNMSVDPNNHMTVEYNVDGLGWNTLATFRPPSGSFPSGLAEDTNNDGFGDGTALSTTFQDFCYQVPVTGANIEVRVSTDMSGSSLRQSAFDFIRVKGQAPYSYTYLWSTSDTTQDVSGLSQGTYWVTITGQNACVVSDTFTITDPCVPQTLTASFTLPSDTICVGDCFTPVDNSTGANINSWNWTFASGTPGSSSNQTPGNICYTTPGIYNITLQVTDASSNTDDTTIVITVLAPTTGITTATICQGDSILLGGTYQTVAGNYYDTLINVFGCDSVLTTTLTIDPKDDAGFSYSATTYCLSDPNPSPTITGLTGGTFTIDNSGVINATTGEINIASSGAGAFNVTYTTNGTCPSDSTVTINITSGANATISAVANLCENENQINLNAVDGGGVWSGVGITDTVNGIFDPSVAGAGNHTITYAISSSCGDTDTVVITVLSVPTNNMSITICQGDSILLGGSFQTTAGTYNDTLAAGAANGCDSIVVTTLTVNPVATGTATATICQGDSILLGGTYQTTAGNYVDTITGGATNGCDSILTTTLSINPINNNNSTVTICQGDSALIHGNYETTAGMYSQTFTNINGCDSIENVTLVVNAPTNTTQVINFCAGDSVILGGNTYYTNTTVVDTFTNAIGCDSLITYQITQRDTFNTINNVSICDGESVFLQGGNQTTSGTYVDNYTSVYGCDSLVTTHLTVNPLPIAFAGNDTTVGYNSTITLNGSGGIVYTWNPSTGLSCSNCANPTVTITNETTFYLMVTDANGCSSTDQVTIFMDDSFVFFVPNIFSPNGDNENDVFYVRGQGFKSISINIFNRWGQKVFESDDVNTGWDGTFNGQEMNTGVFVYYINLELYNGDKVQKQGNITLVR
ncbi:MAG: hypothetical protein VR77_12160 [Flavobacteriales bacterium BRH_c54]|nr:MAG: hypothetical protein VR77_12160 [Flavobacteriales bacterium BRH_c54]